jgi:hypothetical protein
MITPLLVAAMRDMQKRGEVNLASLLALRAGYCEAGP